MTRQEYALAALPAIIIVRARRPHPSTPEDVAKHCFEIADAMIKAQGPAPPYVDLGPG